LNACISLFEIEFLKKKSKKKMKKIDQFYEMTIDEGGGGPKEIFNNDNITILSTNNKQILSKAPISSEILNPTEQVLPYILQVNSFCKQKKTRNVSLLNSTTIQQQQQQPKALLSASSNVDQFKRHQDQFELEASKCFVDYFIVEPEMTKTLEIHGSENSLFLAISRALLYKIHFVDKNYIYVLRDVLLKSAIDTKEFQFTSDIALQEVIRKRLCLFWLSHVQDGQFIHNNCKYKK
jgi:hypothetical protein